MPRSRPVPGPLVLALSCRFAPCRRLAGRGRPAWSPRVGPGQPFRYRPKLAVSESLQPFLDEITPGSDLFPDERVAAELIARLSELGAKLKESPDRASRVAELLLAPSFRGGRLRPVEEVAVAGHPALQVFRGRQDGPGPGPRLPLLRPGAAPAARGLPEGHGRRVPGHLARRSDERKGSRRPTCATTSWPGRGRLARRAARASGVCGGDARASGWRVVEWTATEDVRSRASAPVFSEVTTAALGGNDSFRRQLEHRLRRLGRHAGLGLRPRLERPPRRLGRGRRRRRPRRHLRRPAAWIPQPALPGPG